MKIAFLTGLFLIAGGAAYAFAHPAVTTINPQNAAATSTLPENAFVPTSTIPKTLPVGGFGPAPLENPPAVIHAKYFTGWIAGSSKRMDQFLATAEANHINAVVIDIKDYSGYVSYAMENPEAKASGAEGELRIGNIDALVTKLHEHNIYVIARITVFQDPVFAKAHPELALKDKTTGGEWKDKKGLAWLDAAGKPTWEYVAGLADDVFSHGADEVNFDYVRFPSDGDLENAAYPFWDGATPKHEVLRQFFAYLRQRLPERKISADLFGLVLVDRGDMGIGQHLEDALPYFDYIGPMIYPSHFANGAFGYKNPAEHPYEIMHEAIVQGLARRGAMAASSTVPLAKIRPWIQVFDLGATYTPAMIADELRASDEIPADAYSGWMLWDPNNAYKSYDAIGSGSL
jgi:hypothetical protein